MIEQPKTDGWLSRASLAPMLARQMVFLSVGLILAASLLASGAQAEITWGTPKTISGPSDVVATGSLHAAAVFDQMNRGGIVNNVAFAKTRQLRANHENQGNRDVWTYEIGNEDIAVWESGGSGDKIVTVDGRVDIGRKTGDAPYDAILSRGASVAPKFNLGITLKRLTPGTKYLVQVWSYGAAVNRGLTLTSGSTSVVLKDKQFVTGTFTATAATETLTHGGIDASDWSALNAIQVRVLPTQ